MAERVAGLPLGDRAEEGGDVGVALDVGLLGEVQVPAVGLALAGERLLEVLLGLGCPSVRAWSFLSGRGAGSMGSASAVRSASVRRPAHVRRRHVGRTGRGRRPRRCRRRTPGSAPAGTDEPGEVDDAGRAPCRSVRQTRWWWGSSTLGSKRVRAGADVEGGDLAQLGQLVEGLVDGLQRDGRHLAAGGGVDGLGRRVGLVALEDPEDALALGRHLPARWPGTARSARRDCARRRTVSPLIVC